MSGLEKGPLMPKLIAENQLQVDYNRYMRLHQDADENWLLQVSKDMINFTSVYRFNLQETQYIEFLDRHRFYQNDRESPYVDAKYVSKWMNQGLITLTSQKIYNASSNDEGQAILNEDEFLSQAGRIFRNSIAGLIAITGLSIDWSLLHRKFGPLVVDCALPRDLPL